MKILYLNTRWLIC
jgi:hypothetical protein